MRTERRRAGAIGAAQAPLAQRLWRDMGEQLAKQVGCCPIHGLTLVCCLCDVAWTGSAGEERELEALVERTALPDLTWPSWPCGRCGTPDAMLCVDCYGPVSDEAFAGLTPAEEARCGELRTYLRYTCLPDPDGLMGLNGHPMKEERSHEVRRQESAG